MEAEVDRHTEGDAEEHGPLRDVVELLAQVGQQRESLEEKTPFSIRSEHVQTMKQVLLTCTAVKLLLSNMAAVTCATALS